VAVQPEQHVGLGGQVPLAGQPAVPFQRLDLGPAVERVADLAAGLALLSLAGGLGYRIADTR
jgi:hypothetical protein